MNFKLKAAIANAVGRMLLLLIFLKYDSSIKAEENCIIDEQVVNEYCHTNTVMVLDDFYNHSESIRYLYYNFSVTWDSFSKRNVHQHQEVYVELDYGELSYIYLKLTDHPSAKDVSDLYIVMIVNDMRKILSACSDQVYNDISECFYIMQSEYYFGLKIIPKQTYIGGSNCEECISNNVLFDISYNLTDAVCSIANSTIYEGRSYLMYIRQWNIPPAPFRLSFKWPQSVVVSEVILDSRKYRNLQSYQHTEMDSIIQTRASLDITYGSIYEIENLEYISWFPSKFIGPCFYGKDATKTIHGFLVALGLLGASCCLFMIILVGWSKYAEWRWNGWDRFEWDTGENSSVTSSSVGNESEIKKREMMLMPVFRGLHYGQHMKESRLVPTESPLHTPSVSTGAGRPLMSTPSIVP